MNQPTIECPKCGHQLEDDPKYHGKKVECPQCNAVFKFPRREAVLAVRSEVTEKQLLTQIRDEMIKTNKMVSLFYRLVVINLVILALTFFLAVLGNLAN